jgi:hypothetical protein
VGIVRAEGRMNRMSARKDRINRNGKAGDRICMRGDQEGALGEPDERKWEGKGK